MPQKEVENRSEARVPSNLQTVVQVRGSAAGSWKEVVDVTTVSRIGAGFTLSRPCVVGSLVKLVMPLPDEHRAYDLGKELYPVMGLVQYCNEVTVDGTTQYRVGVGFIGKNVPESFKSDPLQSYRIAGMSENGLWMVTESDTQFKPRRNPRFWLKLDVTISLMQKARKAIDRENTHTVEIGSAGTSVVCSLEADKGDRVKLACPALDFYAIAVVRNRRIVDGQPTTLHLEFVEAEFPVEKILLAEPSVRRVD